MNNWQYTPGQTYPITVTVSKTGMPLFGVDVECLTSTNGNAGTFTITNTASTRLLSATVSGVSRVNVTHKMNGGLAANSKSFTFNWTAPAAGTGPVKFTFQELLLTMMVVKEDYVYFANKALTELTCTPPSIPGAISGSANNNCGIITKTYSIATVSGATSYAWRTDIVGATINGTTGIVTTTTPSVSLTFPSNFANAKLYVKAQNACGASLEKTKTISSKPPVPVAITGPLNPCTNSTNLSYSITPVAQATSYSWKVPSGLSLVSGQGTTNLLINSGAIAKVCSLKVGSTNACGTSSKRLLVVNVTSCIREFEYNNNALHFIDPPERIDIFSADGRLVQQLVHPSNENSLADLPYGIYIISMRFNDHIVNEKIFVQNNN
ncbi:MAG: hypothetical protein IPK10_02840 [Bacteroidetes bacterium]|nr:hypothetical protein [Bacteroidota bacterium]